jgi:two-component system NtrC family sensor kinase
MKPNLPTSDSFTVISSLAHELDSPLKSILSRTKKLINDYKNRDFEFISYKDFKVIISTLEQVERQLEHCSRTTSRMLYVGKRHARMEENNYQVNDVIKSVSDLLSHQLKSAHIKLVTRLEKQLPLVTVGPVECYQIINNVIINSVQAMPGGGVIRVRTFLDKVRGSVGIDITDEGVGITPDHLSKVFEPFFTTKERGIDKSSGLGLSITHSIISAAGGSIHIKSSLRKGTTVQISLPVYQSK